MDTRAGPHRQPPVRSVLVLTRSLLLGPPWSLGLSDLSSYHEYVWTVHLCVCGGREYIRIRTASLPQTVSREVELPPPEHEVQGRKCPVTGPSPLLYTSSQIS